MFIEKPGKPGKTQSFSRSSMQNNEKHCKTQLFVVSHYFQSLGGCSILLCGDTDLITMGEVSMQIAHGFFTNLCPTTTTTTRNDCTQGHMHIKL